MFNIKISEFTKKKMLCMRFFFGFVSLEDRTDRLSRNVGNLLPILAA